MHDIVGTTLTNETHLESVDDEVVGPGPSNDVSIGNVGPLRISRGGGPSRLVEKEPSITVPLPNIADNISLAKLLEFSEHLAKMKHIGAGQTQIPSTYEGTSLQ